MGELATRNGNERGQLLARLGERYGVDRDELTKTIKQTMFGGKQASNAELMTMLILADQHKLNPLTREFYAFPAKGGGMVPVVGVDGWIRIVNEHPKFDGMSFSYDSDEQAMTCTMWRKDRSHPISVTEFMSECKRGTDPWKTHPRRMLRHKALIQCARAAFGFAGFYDEDEAERIEVGTVAQMDRPADPLLAKVNKPDPQPEQAAPTVEVVQEDGPAEDDNPSLAERINAAMTRAVDAGIWESDAEIKAWVKKTWESPLGSLDDEQLADVLEQVEYRLNEVGS